MKNTNDNTPTFCRCVNILPFRCSVVLLCGDLKSELLRKKYAKEMLRVKAPKDAPKYDEVVSFFGMEDHPVSGLTCVDADSGDCFISLPQWRSSVFVHEVHHAVLGILKARHIEDPSTEVGAYLAEYLFNEIVNTEWADKNFIEDHLNIGKEVSDMGKCGGKKCGCGKGGGKKK